MIYVDTLYISKDGTAKEKTHEFVYASDALRFMYGCYDKHLWISAFRCDDPFDYESLTRRVSLIDLNTGKRGGKNK